MGRPGRRAGMHDELARAPVTWSRGSTRGRFPHLPLPVTLKWCTSPPREDLPMGAPLTALCPCAALTARLQPGGRAPAQAKVHLGFSPSCVRSRGRRREGEWGRRGGAGKGRPCPVTLPVRQDRRSFASAGSRTRCHGRRRGRPRRVGSRDRGRSRAPP
jgi:hypothetical protein